MTLAYFPLEILQHIAVCVETAHRPSLQAFSLTSKACYKASLSVIFRRVSITVRDDEGLERDVIALVEALTRSDSFRHIQQITIKGKLEIKSKQPTKYDTQTPWTVTTGLADILEDEERISYNGMRTVYDERVIESSSEEDIAWAPIVNLLQAPIPLQDLVYNCQSPFPPSLLGILHEQHSRCRLHHLTFRFRSLIWGAPSPYEMELATSPLLYRVKAACFQRDSDGHDDFNLEALQELTTGLAPNLNEVVILNTQPRGCFRSVRPRGSWQGLPDFTLQNKGSLQSLSLKGFSRLNTPVALQDWARCIDFTRLQHLTLGGCFDADTSGLSGETMEWLAQNQSFPRVKTLCVYLKRDDLIVEKPHYSENAISFFGAFESLEQLSIDGPIDSEIMDSVLSRHGQTLRKLSLRPFEETSGYTNDRDLRDIPFEFARDVVLQIEAQCPVLEELAIPVKRNKSSLSEVEVYRCFGRMKRLRSLFLILDCSNWRVARDPTYEPDFNEEDQKPADDGIPFLKRGEMKETFINCAVDETLACSIWKTINQNKSGRRLERLKLWPTGEGKYGSHHNPNRTFEAIAAHLTRSWLIERVPRDDTEDFKVTELRQKQRKAGNHEDARYLAADHDPEVWEVFRSIWPSQPESKDWEDDWASFPL